VINVIKIPSWTKNNEGKRGLLATNLIIGFYEKASVLCPLFFYKSDGRKIK
jgi:hypothetical protein